MKSKVALTFSACLLLLITPACSPQAGSSLPPTLTPPPVQASPWEAATAASTATRTPVPPRPTSVELALLPTVPVMAGVPPAATLFNPGDLVLLDEIHMFSPTAGWGIEGPHLLVTADGGRTWREVTPPTDPSAGVPDRVYSGFLDARTAWVVFGANHNISGWVRPWYTVDGGASWAAGDQLHVEVPDMQAWAVFTVLDARNVWFMVRGEYRGPGTDILYDLFRSTDGGRTWGTSNLNWNFSDNYTGMAFADASFGVGGLYTIGVYDPAPPAFAVTYDGGANWTNLKLSDPPAAPELFGQYAHCETYQPVLLSAQSVRLLVGCFDNPYHPPARFVSYLYASQDGGIHWTASRLPEDVQASQTTLLYFGQQDALLLGRSIYRSGNGGQTWDFVKSVDWDGQFSFVDAQTGWALARAGDKVVLVSTTNGVRTWSALKPVIGP
jgi:photosystem II stability/assembly factor-like uncharacterized protein